LSTLQDAGGRLGDQFSVAVVRARHVTSPQVAVPELYIATSYVGAVMAVAVPPLHDDDR
jgi:hypothetical protein